MQRIVYRWTRNLHLYCGLFVSPFVLLFAASVFLLNHAHPPAPQATPPPAPTVRAVQVPPGIEKAEGTDRLRLVSEALSQVGVAGEIQFVRFISDERRIVVPVVRPGVETTVDLNLAEGKAEITERRTGLWGAVSYLHRSPGPHNASIRGNWFWTRVWRWLADGTVYLTLFLSLSGIYLWVALRAERRVGLALIAAGALSFGGIVYAVVG
ncbi:MAG: hypothetical protein GC160_15485 [Acidobacteria bacterium]|nr:hypothetical protein [Acidobacteriota bacterium]